MNYQYITNNSGEIKSVILPIEIWNQLNCEDETDFLLQSEVNTKRLLEAVERNDNFTLSDVYERIGL